MQDKGKGSSAVDQCTAGKHGRKGGGTTRQTQVVTEVECSDLNDFGAYSSTMSFSKNVELPHLKQCSKLKSFRNAVGFSAGRWNSSPVPPFLGGRQSLGAAGHSNAAWQPGPGARGRSSPAYREQLCRLREDKAIFIAWTQDHFLIRTTTNAHNAFSGLSTEILEAKLSTCKEFR